jgi:16S rRNA (uracil1498-N3)-methyltransferase
MLASLRAAAGDVISATDGKGSLYGIVVEDAAGGIVAGRIVSSDSVARPGPPVHVFQALIRPARLELVVEKATELGVWGFTPVRTSRSRGTAGPARLDRLRKTAIEAMKQSLGTYLPEISQALSMEAALEMPSEVGLVLVARGGERDRSLREALQTYDGRGVALWIGPEGGFSAPETRALEDRGAIPFTLGPGRLKSETAAIASLAILRALT